MEIATQGQAELTIMGQIESANSSQYKKAIAFFCHLVKLVCANASVNQKCKINATAQLLAYHKL